MLYLVATPIGNLGDISTRALDTLRSANIIAAEDTRVSRKLLSHYAIPTPLIPYHGHSSPAVTATLVRRMSEGGETVAFITDAGTPGISDPGADLVAAAIDAGVAVVPIPGPAALIAALVGSGLPSARFVFEGFLPRTRSTRLQRLGALKNEIRTIVFYESPQRIGATLAEIAAIFGVDRPACVARELTKKFEEFRRGALGDLAAFYSLNETRGECVLVVAGTDEADEKAMPADECEPGGGGLRGNALIKALAGEIGVDRRALYRLIADLKNSAR